MTPLGPNIFFQDVFLSLKLLCGFGKKDASQTLEDQLGGICFNSGRSAMMAILQSLNLPPNSEVLIQGYTCVAVPDAVLWSGVKPVFVDIKEENFNMDPQDLEKKITPLSKVVVVQHTFGITAPMKEILQIARRHKLFVIEDMAHTLSLSPSGDAAFFSFGRDKVISSVFGGLAVTGIKNLELRIKNLQKKLDKPVNWWIMQQLLYNPFMFLVIKTYDLFLGKLLHLVLTKINLLSKAVLDEEKKGLRPHIFPQKMPYQLAELALWQLKRLDSFNEKRLKISEIYYKNLRNLPIKHPPLNSLLLRYPILVDNPQKLMDFARKKRIYLGNWYDSVIAPKDSDPTKIYYLKGSCPKAEKLASKTVNLLLNPNMSEKDVWKIVKVVKDYYAKN